MSALFRTELNCEVWVWVWVLVALVVVVDWWWWLCVACLPVFALGLGGICLGFFHGCFFFDRFRWQISSRNATFVCSQGAAAAGMWFVGLLANGSTTSCSVKTLRVCSLDVCFSSFFFCFLNFFIAY